MDSFISSPLENAAPAPVMTTARISSSSRANSNAARSSSFICWLSALRKAGRLSVSKTPRRCFSNKMVSNVPTWITSFYDQCDNFGSVGSKRSRSSNRFELVFIPRRAGTVGTFGTTGTRRAPIRADGSAAQTAPVETARRASASTPWCLRFFFFRRADGAALRGAAYAPPPTIARRSSRHL